MAKQFAFIEADFSQVTRMITRLEAKLVSPALALWLDTRIEPYLRARAENRFAVEGDTASGKWAPLLPSTELIRIAQGYPPAHPINKRTGALEAYITKTPGKALPFGYGAALRFPGKRPTNSPKNPLRDKVAVAQTGGTGARNRRATVPRPVLAMNENDLEYILVMLSRYFEML